jgi:hypothetical protein
MSVDEVLSVCTLMLPAVVRWFLRVHLRETARGRLQSVHMQTEVLALRAGETVVEVMERGTGPSIFLTRRTTERPHDA